MEYNLAPNDYQHWRLEVDAEGIAWATLDKAG